jgi:hypothetical protein
MKKSSELKKSLLSEIRRMQTLAGILREYIQSDPESIAYAFSKAGIDVSKPVTYILSSMGDDEPVTVLGAELLRDLQAEREDAEAADPEFNEVNGVTYDYDLEQGSGELSGDYYPEEVKGKNFKLTVAFSDSHSYEIWQ